jgi:hypothetical protein
LSQDVAFDRRESFHLDVQQAADSSEHRAVVCECVCEKCADVTRVDLADCFAHDLQRQTVPAVALNQARPALRVAIQVFVGEHCLSFGHAKAMKLQCVCSRQKCELRRSLAAGQHQAAQMRRFADGLQNPTVAIHVCSVATLALAGFEQGLRIVKHQQAPSRAQQLQQRGNPV